jgi:ribonuclease BN (tRNA processing enzyme)
MRLTILGSGTCDLDKKHHEAGYLLEAEDRYYLFDSGAGTVYRLLEVGIELDQLDHLFYTHLHNDHINDLPAILWSNNYKTPSRTKELTIHGPLGIKRYYDILRDHIIGKEITFSYNVIVKEITNQKITIEGVSIETKELNHFGNIAYRVVDPTGKIFVYSGDTQFCQEIIDISNNADLLVLECGVLEEGGSHLTPQLCAKIAKEANVKKLILIHLYPQLDPDKVISIIKKEFSGEVILGQDLMEDII